MRREMAGMLNRLAVLAMLVCMLLLTSAGTVLAAPPPTDWTPSSPAPSSPPNDSTANNYLTDVYERVTGTGITKTAADIQYIKAHTDAEWLYARIECAGKVNTSTYTYAIEIEADGDDHDQGDYLIQAKGNPGTTWIDITSFATGYYYRDTNDDIGNPSPTNSDYPSSANGYEEPLPASNPEYVDKCYTRIYQPPGAAYWEFAIRKSFMAVATPVYVTAIEPVPTPVWTSDYDNQMSLTVEVQDSFWNKTVGGGIFRLRAWAYQGDGKPNDKYYLHDFYTDIEITSVDNSAPLEVGLPNWLQTGTAAGEIWVYLVVDEEKPNNSAQVYKIEEDGSLTELSQDASDAVNITGLEKYTFIIRNTEGERVTITPYTDESRGLELVSKSTGGQFCSPFAKRWKEVIP